MRVHEPEGEGTFKQLFMALTTDHGTFTVRNRDGGEIINVLSFFSRLMFHVSPQITFINPFTA